MVTKLANGNWVNESGLEFRMSREGVAVPVNCSVGHLLNIGLARVSPSLHESLDWAQKLSKPGDSFPESLVDFTSGSEILTSMGMRYPRADEVASLVSSGVSYEGWLNLAFDYDGKFLDVIIDPSESAIERRRFHPYIVNANSLLNRWSSLSDFDSDFLEFVFGRDSKSLPRQLLTARVVLQRGFNPVMIAGDPLVLRSDQPCSYLSGVRLKDDS